MATKVIVRVIRKPTTDGASVLCLESIRKPTDSMTYEIPIEFQHESYHIDMFRLPLVQAATRSLKKNGQYRHLKLTFNLELYQQYTDEEGNFVFNNMYLEEIEIPTKKTKNNSEGDEKNRIGQYYTSNTRPRETIKRSD